ncbi:hypothetical protein S245_069039, partial [Arachis hypogaea]
NMLFRCGIIVQKLSQIQNSSFSVNVEEVNGLESYVDKVYNSVMDSSLGFNNLENALDQLGVPLSTPLVTEVLYRLRYDEKIAFRFFTWAGCQQNYSHEPCAYNDMMDILSCTKCKTKQFRIVCDMLEYMKRHNKNTVLVEVLLTILRRYTEKYLTLKTQPEINAFNLLLDALCKCCLVEDAEGLYKKVRKRIRPNADTHNILVFGWCKVRNPTRAMKFLEEMIELGQKPDNFTYNTALDTFFKAAMITEALNLVEFMRTKGSTISSPTAKTYAIVIVALVQNDRMEECFEHTGHMISNGCLPGVSTYKDIIEGMCLNGKIDEAYKFVDEMGNKGYPLDIVTYNCFLKILCDNKKSEEALKLYGRMIEFGCLPMSLQTGHTYCVVVEGLFRCNRIDDAFILLEELINKGIKLPYRKLDSFLMQLSIIGDLHAIHRLSDHMRKFYNHAMARRYALSQKRKSMSLRGNSSIEILEASMMQFDCALLLRRLTLQKQCKGVILSILSSIAPFPLILTAPLSVINELLLSIMEALCNFLYALGSTETFWTVLRNVRMPIVLIDQDSDTEATIVQLSFGNRHGRRFITPLTYALLSVFTYSSCHVTVNEKVVFNVNFSSPNLYKSAILQCLMVEMNNLSENYNLQKPFGTVVKHNMTV